MATAREESNPYDGGLGVGGKFRKRPFRRTAQTTPYDRPPTAIRNPSGTGHRNGWLSKLVDPAQRLITSSAHRLFASVFRKRLPPPPPHQPQASESETNKEARENPPAATSTDPSVVQGGDMGYENPGNHTDEGGVAELEEILKQKTFTSSEIAQLTCLLRSRTVDNPGGNEERSKVKPEVSCDKKEKFPKTLVRENGTENHLISMPVVSSTVLDEDVASPAQLAKAYMGSRPSKVSVSMLGLHNEVPRGDLISLSNKAFPSKSPIMSLVRTSSGHVGSLGNDFVTPRPRGRSTIYSMARTPCSRVNSAAVLKGAGTTSDAFGGPSSSSSSSSQSALEQYRTSGSRQGVLKRRSSVLDNDIGSISHIRRIRQKSNVLDSKNLNLPSSTGPLSIQIAGTSSVGLDTLAENGDNCIPGTSFTPVPSKSSEMASKILQQLDKLVSPREKSPTMLSPSMLRGQALKSLGNVDYSKFLENMRDSDKLIGSHTALPDIQDFKSHKCDKENGSTTLVALSDKSVPTVNGVDNGSLMKYNNEPIVKAADSTVIKSVLQLPQQKRRAFQMSAHEDYLDLDGDDYPNGAASATFGEGGERSDNCVTGSKSAAAEAILVDKPSGLSEVKSIPSSSFNKKPDLTTSDGSSVVENNAGVTFPIEHVATSSVPAALLVSQSTSTANKDAASEEPKATSPMLSFGEKVSPPKQLDTSASIFGFASTNVGEVSSANGSSGVKLGTNSDQKLDNSSSFATTAPSTTDYWSDKTDKNTLNGIFFRTPETATSCAVSTSTSAGSIFKFGASKNSPTLNNGSLASSPFSFSSTAPSLMPNNGGSSSSSSTNFMSFTTNGDTFSANTTSTTANVTISSASSPFMEASISSFTAASVFKFASPGDPSASSSTLSATEAKTQDSSSDNVAIIPSGSTSVFTSSGSNIFGSTAAVAGTVSSTSGCVTAVVTTSGNSSFSDTSSTITNSGNGFFNSTFSTVTNTGNGIFSGTSATADTGSSVFGGTSLSIASTGSSVFSTTPAISSTGSNIFGFGAPAASLSTTQAQGLNPFNAVNTQASAAGTGIGTSTQSMPIQFSSSASSPSSPSFGLAGNTTFSSGNNSVFGSSSSVAKPLGAGVTFGITSSSSETNSLSSSSGIASSTFDSTWQASKTPIFGSSSSGFCFGSSASVTAPSSAPTIFGSSTGASSSSIFSFTSAAATTPSQPVFGNTSPGLVFGSTPSSNNDQMEDSMAEDTVQASTPTVPSFGQQPISPPASGLVFGASNPSGASSFQFGAQPSTATPQNPSPFQVSGSLEFGGGGRFSLGSSGGDKSARKFVKVRKQRKK